MAARATHCEFRAVGIGESTRLRTVTLPNGDLIRYHLDAQNRRIAKDKNGVRQYGLLWLDSLRPIAELDASGQLRSVFHYAEHANIPSAMERDGKLYRILHDHLGSVRLVIDTTNGIVVQQMDYDVWGKVIQDSHPGFQPFGFAGGLHDPDTGLTRFGARDYDAETGRWTSKDPILFNGGDMNLYGYVLQDPVNGVDASGLRGSARPNRTLRSIRRDPFALNDALQNTPELACDYWPAACVKKLEIPNPNPQSYCWEECSEREALSCNRSEAGNPMNSIPSPGCYWKCSMGPYVTPWVKH